MIDRRKDKHCSKCGEFKGQDEFYTTFRYNVEGVKVLYCLATCKECNRTKHKEPITGPKRCHCCYKYKPDSQYRKSKRGSNILVESHWCKECEKKYGNYSINHELNLKPTVNDVEKTKHHCAFIGNKSYEHICSIFKIRPSGPMLKERTYKQMGN